MSKFFPAVLDFDAVQTLKQFFFVDGGQGDPVTLGAVVGAGYHLEGFALGQWFGAADAPHLAPPPSAFTTGPAKSPEYCFSILEQFEAIAKQHVVHEQLALATTLPAPVGAFDWGFALTLALQVVQELLRRLTPTPVG